MATFFSPSRLAFFDEAIHGARILHRVDEAALEKALAEAADDDARAAIVADPPTVEEPNAATLIPADAVEISQDEHAKIMDELSQGRELKASRGGKPVVAERVVDVQEQLDGLRRQRDRDLAATDWTQLPDALTMAKRKLWADHRKALRDLPAMIEKAVAAGKPIEDVPYPAAPGASAAA